MADIAPVDLTVFPDDCDSYGHLNQASVIRLFERARWEALARGPGMDVFSRNDAWPAVRKVTVEYRAQAFPGDVLRFALELAHPGRTSFTLRQAARRVGDDVLVADGEFVFVCLGPRGSPVPVPAEVSGFFGERPSRLGMAQRLAVRGVSLAFDAHGDGLPVLFLHAFPLDRSMWRPVSAALTRYRRIPPDLRGFGASDVPDSGYSIGEYAADMAELVRALRAGPAVVCGISMGGYVAFELYRRHPEIVRALVLVNTRAEPDDAEGRARRDAMIARVRRDGCGFLADEMVPKLLAPESQATRPEVVSQVRTIIGRAHPNGVAGALAAMRDREDATPVLPTIRVPTLVIAGRGDQLIAPAAQRAMADAIPEAHFTQLPDAGHLAPLEQPVNTGRVIGEFLEALP